MGLGLGAMGFLLVMGVRGGSDDAPRRPAMLEAPGTRDGGAALDATTSDGAAPSDGATDGHAAPLAPSPAQPPAPPPPPPVFRVATLAGDSTLALADGTLGHRAFLTALTASGLGLREAYRVLHAIGKVHNMNHTSPTDAFHVAKEKASGHVVAFEYVTSPVDVFQARDEGGTLSAKKLELRVERKPIAAAVTVTSDLKASVAKAGFEPEVLARIDDALDGHAELDDLHAGSRLRVLATEERIEGAFARYASIDALEYTPAERGATLRVYRFPPFDREKAGGVAGVTGGHTGGGSGTFYDAKGQQPYHGGWRIPVPGARIASRFNLHRMHPTLHVVMPHNGVDFAAPTGTPIYAAASGTVKTAGDSGPCGNMVQIEHAGGSGGGAASLISSYCHMSKFATGLHVGEHVETRQLIGYVGQTGRATGPHLHFAIKRNGVFIDPLAMKLDGVRVVPPSQRDEFEARRGELDKALDAIPLEPGGPDAGPPPADSGASAAPGPAGQPPPPDGGTDDPMFDETPLQ